MRLEWERIRGGRRPSYALRHYTDKVPPRGYLAYNPVIGWLELGSVRRMRWRVSVALPNTLWGVRHTEILCYLTRVTEQEALDAARMLLQGYANE